MMILPLGAIAGVLLGWLMAFLSLFLIMLILVQRGKGGGLTGALGGPGGQSAFGSKAGDMFTGITIVVASLWGLTCIITMLVLGDGGGTSAAANPSQGVQQGAAEPAELDNAEEIVVPSAGAATESMGLGGVETSDSLTPPADLTESESVGEDAADNSDSASKPAETVQPAEDGAADESAGATEKDEGSE